MEQTIGIVFVLALCALANTYPGSCPDQCHCTFTPNLDMYSCALGNSTAHLQINIVEEFIYLSFDCQNRQLTCADIPKLLLNKDLRVIITACSASEVLRCVKNVAARRQVYSAKVHVPATWNASMDEVRALGTVTRVELNFTEPNTPLPVAAINSWSSIKHLYIWRETKRPTQATHHNVTTLHAASFVGLTSLISLYIIDNNLETISADAFRGLDALEKLNMINNKVQTLEDSTFTFTPRLRSLIISMFMLKTLPDGLLQGMQQLEEVWLISNKVNMSLGEKTFSQLGTLKFIDISNSKITSLKENVFNNSNCMQILRISNNSIATLPLKIFWSLSSLKLLDLSYNRLTELSKNIFANLNQLKRLDLSNNQIESLPKSLFSNLKNLTQLNLSNNKFTSITWKIVYNPRKIQLTYNWNESVVSQQQDSPFKLLTSLRTLHLEGNQISKLHEHWPTHLRHLQVLNLARNTFADIEDITKVNFSKVNMTIDLSYNYIRYIRLPSRLLFTEDQRAATTSIVLDGNPIECDWHNYGLFLRLNGKRQPGEPNYLLEDRCQSPPNTKGQLLKEISPELLICDLSDHCPVACECIGTIDDIAIHCPFMPSYDDFYIYTLLKRDITLSLDNGPDSIAGFNIHKLNISHIELVNITFSPVDSLKILDVSGNKLSTIPIAFLKANISIYLSNNYFVCDCSFVNDIAELNEYGLIPDFDQATCSNGDTVARVSQFCTEHGISISGIGYSVFGALILFIAGFKLFLRSNEVWMYILKIFCRRKYDEKQNESMELILDADKNYDLFVSFADEDKNFVKEQLISKLKNEFKQKVCVRAFDLNDRNLITDQIIDSVESSKKTMVILTEHLLISEWSYLEFRTAYNLYLQDGRARIIVIVIKEETLKDQRICEELISYISDNAYLLWGANNFWDKLQKKLPRKNRK